MKKPLLFVSTALLTALLFSCSEEPTSIPIDQIQEIQFEVYDSLLVDVMVDVTILDYQEELDQYLMKEKRGGKILLVNGEGEVISETELAGEGPNQVPMIWEGRFMGKGSVYIQGDVRDYGFPCF